MAGHESLVGQDTEVHRRFHDLMDHARETLHSPKTGLEPTDPDNEKIIHDLFFHMAQYVYRNLVVFAQHERVHHGVEVDPATTHEFAFQAGFHVGLRISDEARELFALGKDKLKVLSDEQWQKDLVEEAELAAEQARLKTEWEEQIKEALKLDDETYEKFRSGELEFLTLKPEDREKIQHLIENAPTALGHHHGHGHGHFASRKHDDAKPEDGTGLYL